MSREVRPAPAVPDILRPDTPVREGAKLKIRQYAHALEGLIDPYS